MSFPSCLLPPVALSYSKFSVVIPDVSLFVTTRKSRSCTFGQFSYPSLLSSSAYRSGMSIGLLLCSFLWLGKFLKFLRARRPPLSPSFRSYPSILAGTGSPAILQVRVSSLSITLSIFSCRSPKESSMASKRTVDVLGKRAAISSTPSCSRLTLTAGIPPLQPAIRPRIGGSDTT